MSPWQKPSHSGCHSCKGVWEIDTRLFNDLLETGSCYIAHVGTESEACFSLLSTQIMGLGHVLASVLLLSVTGRTQGWRESGGFLSTCQSACSWE